MIQITDIQDKKFYMKINNVDCVFMPMCLFVVNKFLPLIPKIKGSTLCWYVGRKYVSYNQIKREIIKKIKR